MLILRYRSHKAYRLSWCLEKLATFPNIRDLLGLSKNCNVFEGTVAQGDEVGIVALFQLTRERSLRTKSLWTSCSSSFDSLQWCHATLYSVTKFTSIHAVVELRCDVTHSQICAQSASDTSLDLASQCQ